MYRATPRKPCDTSSRVSWPVLPIVRPPHRGHASEGPMAMDSSLPSVLRVLPKPMIGEDWAASMAVPRSDPRTSLLWPLSSRLEIIPSSGDAATVSVSTLSTPTTTSSALTRPQKASRTTATATARPRPIHIPRLREKTIGAIAMTSTMPSISRRDFVPSTPHPTTSHTSRRERLLPHALVKGNGAAGRGDASPSTGWNWARVTTPPESPVSAPGRKYDAGVVKENCGSAREMVPSRMHQTASTPSHPMIRRRGSSASVVLPTYSITTVTAR